MSRETCTQGDLETGAPGASRTEAADADTVKHTVRELTRAADAGPPSLQRVAQHFCITPRTLQRRLRDAGTTFRQLVNEVRLERATHRLKDPGTVVMDAAEAAGFSEASCFHRAFKRWTGQTPTAFRVIEQEHE